VRVGWSRQGSQLEVRVLDDGLGLPNTANLFVPFFTTKPGGSALDSCSAVRLRKHTAANSVWRTAPTRGL